MDFTCDSVFLDDGEFVAEFTTKEQGPYGLGSVTLRLTLDSPDLHETFRVGKHYQISFAEQH